VEQTGAEHFAMQMLKAMAREIVLVMPRAMEWAKATLGREQCRQSQRQLKLKRIFSSFFCSGTLRALH
jgi:hypothetical protein